MAAKTGEGIIPYPTALRLVRRDDPPAAVAVERTPHYESAYDRHDAPERLLFRRIVRDLALGILPPVATIILVALVVLVFGR